jgi:hypothetical protein
MQTEFIVNGGVSLLLIPDNDAEEALIKQLMKQNNDLTEIRSRIMVLNKSFNNGVLIGKKELGKLDSPDINLDESKPETM